MLEEHALMTPKEFVAAINRHQRFLHKQADGVRADLTGQNLSGLRLPNLNFRDAILTDADFRDAVIRGCNFRNAELPGQNFRGRTPRRRILALPTCGGRTSRMPNWRGRILKAPT